MRNCIAAFFMTFAVIFTLTSCLDPMERAAKKLDEHCGSHPVCMRLRSSECPDQNLVYDLTGDGHDDLMTCIIYGSGLVRQSVIVYDIENDVFYELGGDVRRWYHYEVAEDGTPVIVEERTEQVGYRHYTMRRQGTAELIDGELVFVPDP